MYTSLRPDSVDVYATHWPSGENVACDSLYCVFRKEPTRWPASIVRTSMSKSELRPIVVKRRNFPSGDQLVGLLRFSLQEPLGVTSTARRLQKEVLPGSEGNAAAVRRPDRVPSQRSFRREAIVDLRRSRSVIPEYCQAPVLTKSR